MHKQLLKAMLLRACAELHNQRPDLKGEELNWTACIHVADALQKLTDVAVGHNFVDDLYAILTG